MLSSVPFLWVNMAALCAFSLMFAVFIAAKKTPEIKAFLVLVLDCVCWTAGSIFMRLQFWPGIRFWYTVSLLAIFSMECVFYIFLQCFFHSRTRLLLYVFTGCTLFLVPGTISGYFLSAPTAVQQPGNRIGYIYTLNWHMVIPCLLFVAIILASLDLLRCMWREQGAHASGVSLLFYGGLVMLAGNLMQISIPGNTFPFDTLSGVIFACTIAFALYRRRLFRMTLVISRGLLLLAVGAVCLLMEAYFIVPLNRFCTQHFALSSEATTMLVTLILTAMLVGSYTLFRRLIDALFCREERQNKHLKKFTADIVQTLSTDDIMKKLSDAVCAELPVRWLYICLPEKGSFTARCCSDPLAAEKFTIAGDSPKIRYLQQEPYLIVSEFSASAQAMSDWAEEKALFRRLQIDCAAAMRDGQQIVGLVLISANRHDRPFNAVETGFLETACSVASIAMKNAALYEKIFREARIDPLTDAYNYRSFIETLEEQFRVCGHECLTLLYVDVDDFKLYNQLYGVSEGDHALRRICAEITLATGSRGMVFRTSGKVFTVLLPHQDAQQGFTLSGEIQKRIARINAVPDRRRFKPLSASIGICAAPYAASSAKELMDNTDLACYNAKQAGKNQIVLFRGACELKAQHLSERTEIIVDGLESSDSRYRSALSMISALTAAIDAKDHYTYAHSKNVARYAANLAVAAGLNDEQVRTIYAAGLLHDIGKISIPERILNKTGRLNEEEYNLMKDHVNNSIEMIRHLPEMDYVVPAVMGHHERWDGKGYPRGIAGEDIPITARCLSVADVFDAMTTDRPYRGGMTLDYVMDILTEGAGAQFDPRLAMLFVDLVRKDDMPLSPQIRDRRAVLPCTTPTVS